MKLRDVIIDKDLTIEMLFYKHVDNNFSLNMKIISIFHLQIPKNTFKHKPAKQTKLIVQFITLKICLYCNYIIPYYIRRK